MKTTRNAAALTPGPFLDFAASGLALALPSVRASVFGLQGLLLGPMTTSAYTGRASATHLYHD